MKITCGCGHEFEGEDGVERVKCPNCGREVEVKPAGDWLESVDLGQMTLEGEAEPAATPPGEGKQAAGPEQPAAAEAGEPGLELEQPQPGQPAQPAQPTRPAAPRPRLGARAAATQATGEHLPPPEHLWDVLKRVLARPEDGLPYFEKGITSRGYIIETGIVFVVLALVGGGLVAYLGTPPTTFGVEDVLGSWLRFVIELVAASIVLSLLCYLFKKGPRPLGAVEGLAFVRAVAWVPTIVVSLAVVVLVILTRGEGAAPGPVEWAAANASYVYWLVVFGGQTMLVVSMLKLGCAPSLILSFVLTYGGWAMAQKLSGVF